MLAELAPLGPIGPVRLAEVRVVLERRLTELQSKKEGAVSSLIITPEEREEIERFQEKRLETRKKLRDVKYEMNAEIEALGRRAHRVQMDLLDLAQIGRAVEERAVPDRPNPFDQQGG